MSIESNTRKILRWLYEQDNGKPEEWYQGPIIQEKLELRVHELNDAVSVLDERGLITRMNWMGTSPYRFGQIRINPHGKNEFEKQIANDTGTRDFSQKLLFFSYSVNDKEIVGEVSNILVNKYGFDVFRARAQ